jgi:asparagine synthase (glutamine-hydrolysing)
MCGISAIFRFEGDAGTDLADLDRMHRAQRHRGPDGEGAMVIDRHLQGRRYEQLPVPSLERAEELRLVAAVRQLRTCGVRAVADQPLVSADGRHWVMLNGAIYNFPELATELSTAGHRFHRGSDSEVVLQAYRQWGTSCFARFNGMWAVLIVDLDRKVLVGSRDRIGIKPFYFALDRARLLFASEPWAIAQVLAGGPAIGSTRFFEFLSGYPPRSATLSFFRGVDQVPAGTWFETDLRDARVAVPRFRTYWDLADYRCDGTPPMSFTDAAERFRELLKASVASQSVADVKVASLLSGGFDSSTIVMIWSELTASRCLGRPDTLSIAWGDAALSERVNIEAITAKAGSNSHILQLSASDVWMAVDDVVRAQGQPLLGQELIAQNFAYRLARQQGAIVVMDGIGLDEVQAGLPLYEAEMTLERLLSLQFVDLARQLHGIARNYRRSYPDVVLSYLVAPLKRRLRKGRVLPSYPWLEQCGAAELNFCGDRDVDCGRDRSLLNRTLYRETRHANVPTVLMYSDRNAMAHSVEVRFPYLDHRIVELCFSLPASYKVGFGRRKLLLFETAKHYLPARVVENQEKRPFPSINDWMPLRSKHAAALRDASRSTAWTKLAYVDARKLRHFVDDYLAGWHNDGYAVWRIYTASRWLDLFGL